MIFIKKNGQIVRADGKDLREVVVIVSEDSSSEVITGKEVPVLTEAQFTQAYNNVVDGKVVYVASENDEIFVIKQVNEESGNPVIYFDYYNSHILRYELAEEEVEITAKEYGGVGAVISVNGKAGVVVLDASDLLATNQATIQANLERIDGLIEDANSDIEDLQDEVATVRDIAQAKTNSYVVSLLVDITGTQDEDGNFTSVSAITGVDLSTLKIGDNIFVVDTEAPDFWVSAISPVVKLNKLQTEKIDIENYYTKDEVDDLLDDKADVGDSYTKQETDTLLNAKANSSDVYSKTDADDTFATKTELGNKQDKSNVRTITTATYNGGISSNELTEFTQPMTSLTIASLAVATGDNVPMWKVQFVAGSGFSFTSIPTIVWKYGTPTSWEVNKEYHLVIKKSLEANTYIIEREEDVVNVNTAQTITGVKTYSNGFEVSTRSDYRWGMVPAALGAALQFGRIGNTSGQYLLYTNGIRPADNQQILGHLNRFQRINVDEICSTHNGTPTKTDDIVKSVFYTHTITITQNTDTINLVVKSTRSTAYTTIAELQSDFTNKNIIYASGNINSGSEVVMNLVMPTISGTSIFGVAVVDAQTQSVRCQALTGTVADTIA